MILRLLNNSTTNSQTIDVTNYVMAAIEAGWDMASPSYSTRQFTTSLLKEGGTFTLENPKLKEQVVPLLIGATSSSAAVAIIEQINQLLQTPGTTAEWQDDGLSQPTYFNLASGQCDVAFDYRRGQQHFYEVKMRLFSQPFGSAAGPRLYAMASGVGPVLMISPYASSGNIAIAASAGGYGGQQQGPSSGIFYAGSPSLSGDAPAMLQIAYAGPLAPGATTAGQVPFMAVSWLPDQNYQPLITASQITATLHGANAGIGAVNNSFTYLIGGIGEPNYWSFDPFPNISGAVPAAWAGNHRIFAIAMSGGGNNSLTTVPNSLVPFATSATVNSLSWGLYDLGTFSVRASEAPNAPIGVIANGVPSMFLTAFIVLPDAATWFFNPTTIAPSQYGWPAAAALQSGLGSAPYSNTLIVDDTLPDQFLHSNNFSSFVTNPAGAQPSSARITQYTRGIIPRPDPARGMPILAIVGVGQNSTPSLNVGTFIEGAGVVVGASWSNPQTMRTLAQVNVLERARFVLP